MKINSVKESPSTQGVTFIGGGTDIMPLLKNHVRTDKEHVFVKDLPELQGIGKENDFITIGEGMSLWDISQNEVIKSEIPAAAQAAATASPQIRNIATIGGNVMQDRRRIYFNQSEFWCSALLLCFKTGGSVCHQIPSSPACRAIYYSDMATALIMYDAEVEYLENGDLCCEPVCDLVARHTEANGLACEKHLPVLVTRFLVPQCPEGEKSTFYKYAMRTTIDFPLINFAFCCGNGSAKLVAGAVSTQPVILEKTAAAMSAGKSDNEIVAVCEEELKQKSKPIKEALISSAMKRELYKQIILLLPRCR